MTQETLKLALEALTYIYTETTADEDELIHAAITALREALAQPAQGPVCPECKAKVLYECVACSSNNYPPKPKQELLTDEEIYMHCPNWLSQEVCKTWVRQIEAAHGIKEKNT